jgi:hypothetical protein
MKFKFRALLLSFFFATGCSAEVPRVDFAYQGNGDARILEFMRANYMSTEAGVARYLKRHLEDGLQPGQVIDKPYLVQRGAICIDGTPVVCKFNGIANEYFGGLPKENAERAHRVTNIEARVLLLQSTRVEVIKEESYPDVKKP